MESWDIEIVDKRLDKIKKTLRSGSGESKKEIEVLENVRLQLENVSVNKSDYSDDQFEDYIKPLELISFKPILYVCNVGENDVISGNDYVDEVRKEIGDKDSEIIIISAITSIAAWCIFTLLSYIWGYNPLRAPWREAEKITSNYEEVLESARAREATKMRILEFSPISSNTTLSKFTLEIKLGIW